MWSHGISLILVKLTMTTYINWRGELQVLTKRNVSYNVPLSLNSMDDNAAVQRASCSYRSNLSVSSLYQVRRFNVWHALSLKDGVPARHPPRCFRQMLRVVHWAIPLWLAWWNLTVIDRHFTVSRFPRLSLVEGLPRISMRCLLLRSNT